MGGITAYTNPAMHLSINNKMASQFGVGTTAGYGAGAYGGAQGLSLLAVSNTAALAPSALSTATTATI